MCSSITSHAYICSINLVCDIHSTNQLIVVSNDITSDCCCSVDLLVLISHGFQVSGLLADRFCKLQATHLACPFVMPHLLPSVLEVHTPLRVDKWSVALSSQPNQAWTGALVEGLQTGGIILHVFAQGLEPIAAQFITILRVDRYLATELALEQEAGLFPDNLPEVVISRFAVIPKSGQPHK